MSSSEHTVQCLGGQLLETMRHRISRAAMKEEVETDGDGGKDGDDRDW